MFIGDAQQNASGISPQSFKGALRFWWRALAWSRIRSNNNDDVTALKELHQQESILFGSSAEDHGIGLVAIKLKIIKKSILSKSKLESSYNAHDNFASYALGQGLLQRKKKDGNIRAHSEYLRNALAPNSEFSITLVISNGITEIQIKSLKDALVSIGSLGGLGSKNRRGLGSICLIDISNQVIPRTFEGFLNMVKNLNLGSIGSKNKPKIIYKRFKSNNAWEALKNTNEDMQMFRGWGASFNNKPHAINRKPAKHNAYKEKESDHQIVYDYIDNQQHNLLPKSIVFGLPRTYGLSNNSVIRNNPNKRGRKEFKLELANEGRSRRASPVVMHIHQLNNNEIILIQTVFSGYIFPKNDYLKISQKINQRFQEITTTALKDFKSNILDEYIEYLKDNNSWSSLEGFNSNA